MGRQTSDDDTPSLPGGSELDNDVARLIQGAKRWNRDLSSQPRASEERVFRRVMASAPGRSGLWLRNLRAVGILGAGAAFLAGAGMLARSGGDASPSVATAVPAARAIPEDSTAGAAPGATAGDAPETNASGGSAPSETPAAIGVEDLPVAAAPNIQARSQSGAHERFVEGPSLTGEFPYIEQARGLLASRRPREARAMLDAHRARYPRGQLAQERDSLEIEAFVMSRDVPQAQKKAREFHSQYPAGLLGPAIDRALTDEGRQP